MLRAFLVTRCQRRFDGAAPPFLQGLSRPTSDAPPTARRRSASLVGPAGRGAADSGLVCAMIVPGTIPRSRSTGRHIMIEPGLKEKVVLITGANNPHGIGAGIARAFAAQGSKVFLHYFRQPKRVCGAIRQASQGRRSTTRNRPNPPTRCSPLESGQARWVTGQRIYVGGGHGM